MRRTIGSWLGIVVLVTGCGGGTRIDEVGVGDCFDDPDSGLVTNLELIDCAQPHDNEVFAEVFLSESTYPGEDGIDDLASDSCLDAFGSGIGESYADSSLDVFYLSPTLESWSEGDRSVLCVLYSADLVKLEGTRRAGG